MSGASGSFGGSLCSSYVRSMEKVCTFSYWFFVKCWFVDSIVKKFVVIVSFISVIGFGCGR